ncbi:MAG TPA: cytochrome c biogenesis protein DipZ [Candidatus Babeliales bacterium]|nr:cytochrome c biogenesis protein DipZ [Candidatus Babeliales bacterium]
MLILLFFAFLAGLVTALSPCILPVLPLLLSAGIGQGKWRQYGIIAGLILSFTFFTLALTAIVHATGLSPNILRSIAIILIIFFGLTMIFPKLEQWFARITAPIARLGTQVQGAAEPSGSGFIGGFILGCALGLIWAPCAGPILAAITTLVATGSITFEVILMTLSYSTGTALPMFFIMYGGNKISISISAIAPYTELIRKLFGILMILGALAIAFHVDVLLQQVAIRYFPVVTIENNRLVKKELDLLQKKAGMQNLSPEPVLGSHAPDFVGIIEWINSPPLTIERLKGKVVLVDFWTYSCINCVRTLPYLKKWYETYKNNNFVIVGVHTPEFEFEKDPKNVEEAVTRFGITYPVALDSDYATWRNYHNQFWPAHYLIDQQGIIRDIHFGEGDYDKTENAIRSLVGLTPMEEHVEIVPHMILTPETYLGYERAQKYTSEIVLKHKETADYKYTAPLARNEIGISGSWFVSGEYIKSKSDNARLSINFLANRVYAVMAADEPSKVTLLLDNKSVPPEFYTKDMQADGSILVKESRMYDLLNLKETDSRHILTLQVPKNVSAYVFTFGSGKE